ncbi:MAG: hypothetical protein WCJ96_11190 [Verrucomicrobiota bacterium]|jgi:hypothetical protein
MFPFAYYLGFDRIELKLTKRTPLSHSTLEHYIRICLKEYDLIEEGFIMVGEGGLAELSGVTDRQLAHMPFTEQAPTSFSGGLMQRLGHVLPGNTTRRNVKLGRLGSAETSRSHLKHVTHNMG